MDASARPQAAGSSSTAGPSGATSRPDARKNIDTPPQQIPAKPISSVPPHMRTTSVATSSSTAKGKSPLGLAEHSTPATVRANNNAAGQTKTGLNISVHTPNHGAPGPRGRSTSDLVHEALGLPKPQLKTEPAPQAVPADPPRERKVSNLEAQIAQALATEERAPALAADEDLDLIPTHMGSYDEYGLNSEDDAFFANVDLGEGDSGVGGHIDFDEGSRAALESFDDSSVAVKPQQQNQKPQPTTTRVQNVLPSSDNGRMTLPRTSTPSMGGFHFPPGMVSITFRYRLVVLLNGFYQ